jgi:hypothetical protein
MLKLVIYKNSHPHNTKAGGHPLHQQQGVAEWPPSPPSVLHRVACPSSLVILIMKEKEMERREKTKYQLPYFYFLLINVKGCLSIQGKFALKKCFIVTCHSRMTDSIYFNAQI